MMKNSLLIASCLLVAQGALAGIVSPQEALGRVYADMNGRKTARFSVNPVPVYTLESESGTPAIYVFDNASGGSLIVSASDMATPLLGYTDSGNFNATNIPPQLQFWMNEYAAQISYAENAGITVKSNPATFSYPSDWTYIAPLVQTKWDQGRPYNNDITDGAFATGCVATAMAQIMKYHEWPEIGHGSNTYTDIYGNTYSMDFGKEPFQWDLMLDSYSGSFTQAQASAVAYLMKACGYSTDMNYSGSSGTQVELAGKALVSYFDYDGSLEVLQRNMYSHSEWAAILYDQLKNVGPVLYSGHSLRNFAHAFVADGYDGNGYFHINWGWSGLADGFYSLDALIPAVQGTGGSNYGGYNFTQGMVVNIMKSQTGTQFTPVGELTLLGNLSAQADGLSLNLIMSEANPGNVCNNSLLAVEPVIGVSFMNEESGDIIYSPVSSLLFGGETIPELLFGPGSFVGPQLTATVSADTSLPDGEYKVQIVWKPADSKADWQQFITANGCHDYFYAIKKGENFTVENLPMERFIIESAEIISPLYMRNPCEIRFTLSNPFDTELTQSIIPVLLYGDERTLCFEGDSRLFTVGPNETIEVTAVYTFSQVSGATLPTISTPREYTLGAYDYNCLLEKYYQSGFFGDAYYSDLGSALMYRPGSNASIALKDLYIGNAAEVSGEGPDQVYGINQFSNIKLTVTIEGLNSFLSTPLSAVVSEWDGTETSDVVYEKNFEKLIYVAEGETATESAVLNMPRYDIGKTYRLDVFFMQQNVRQSLGHIYFAASSGIEARAQKSGLTAVISASGLHISSEIGLAAVRIYDIGGRLLASPQCAGMTGFDFDTTSLENGIYIFSIVNSDGECRNIKYRKQQ